MKAKRVRKLDPQEPLVFNAARILRTRLDEMRSLAHGALQAENETEQHDLRIAAKRLRYVLEATGFCFGAPADTARRRARDLQEVLGELHDCDVMLPRIAAHVESLRSEDAEAVRESAGDAKDLEPALVARAPHRTAYRGLELLSVGIEARRRLLFGRFVELWAEIERAATWERLERAIDRGLARARERREVAERAKRAAVALERAERAEREAAEQARRAAAELAEAREAQDARDRAP